MFETEMSGVMRTPDLHSYITRDFYISPVSVEQGESHESPIGETVTLVKGKSGTLSGATVRFAQFEMDSHAMGSPSGATVGTVLEITKGKETEKAVPAISYEQSGTPKYSVVYSKLLGSNLQLTKMQIGQGGQESEITVGVTKEAGTHQASETLIVEASIHPYIMLVWIGSVLMFLGMIIAYARRKNEENVL
jgi:cytochrome c-type biogenesis protein CcmF